MHHIDNYCKLASVKYYFTGNIKKEQGDMHDLVQLTYMDKELEAESKMLICICNSKSFLKKLLFLLTIRTMEISINLLCHNE